MLQGNLLISNNALTAIIITLACVFAGASILYGVFRKFSRMGWMPWQIPLIFLFTLIAEALPERLGADMRFGLMSAIMLVGIGLVLGGSGFLRHYMHTRPRPAAVGWRAADRVLGAVTALMGYAVVAVCVGGFVLGFFEYAYNPLPDVFAPLFESKAWHAVSSHLLDFVLAALLASAAQAGYRVGLGRAFLTVFLLICAGGSLFLAVYLTTGVAVFRSFAQLFIDAFGTLNPLLAAGLGFGIAVLIEFIVIFSVCAVIAFFLNKLVKRCRYIRVLGIVDGVLLGVIFYAFILLLVCAFNFVAFWFASGTFAATPIGQQLAEMGVNPEIFTTWGGYLEKFFTSSPLASLFYNCNPAKIVYLKYFAELSPSALVLGL